MQDYNQEIATSLIAFYKAKGIDLSYLLSDPIFTSLKTPEKIRFIQDNAKAIQEGITPGWQKSDYKKVGAGALQGVVAGVLPLAITAYLAAHGNKYATKAVMDAAIGTAGGLAIGSAILGAVRTRDDVRARNALKMHLLATSKDPSVYNAVGSLSASRVSGIQDETSGAIGSSLKSSFTDALGSMSNSGLKDRFDANYEHSRDLMQDRVDARNAARQAEYERQLREYNAQHPSN